MTFLLFLHIIDHSIVAVDFGAAVVVGATGELEQQLLWLLLSILFSTFLVPFVENTAPNSGKKIN